MGPLRLSIKLYLTSLALLTAVATIWVLRSGDTFGPGRLLLAAGLPVCLLIPTLLPAQLAGKTKSMLDPIVLLGTVLLFEPAIALLIIGYGALITYALRHDPTEPLEDVVHTREAVIRSATGGLILIGLGWHAGRLVLSDPPAALGLLTAAVVVYLVNTLAISNLMALATDQATLEVWQRSIGFELASQCAHVALGLLAAVVAESHGWALPLVLIPAFAIYLSAAKRLHQRAQMIWAFESLADTVDQRDPYAANHSRRVALYAREIASAMGLTSDEVELIERAARLHDLGKLSVDTFLLTKPRLEQHEWVQFMQHPITGSEILSRFPQLWPAARLVRHHHESVNGSGYPDGLVGDRIPLGARIIAVADAFDAMSTERPYRRALSADVILSELRGYRGVQWDPEVVDTLLELLASGRISLQPVGTYDLEVLPATRMFSRISA